MPPWQSSFSEGITLTLNYFHLFITLPRVDPPTMTVQGIYYVIAANQHLTGLLRYARNDGSSTNLLTMQIHRASLRGGMAAVAIQTSSQRNYLFTLICFIKQYYRIDLANLDSWPRSTLTSLILIQLLSAFLA